MEKETSEQLLEIFTKAVKNAVKKTCEENKVFDPQRGSIQMQVLENLANELEEFSKS